VLIQAAINGTRTVTEHPAIPITPEQQSREAYAAVAAGAGAVHVHVRDADGRESLAPDDVAAAVRAIRAACPSVPVGVSTGAWIVPGFERRLALIRAWSTLPDFASVNFHEEGATQVARLLLNLGIGVEAGIWHAAAADTLLRSGSANECLRILLEPAEVDEAVEPARANLDSIEHALDLTGPPRLLHGLGRSAWFFVQLAARRGYDTRSGFEDTLALPNGSDAESNAALIIAARRIVAEDGGRAIPL
jgi:uncharacterized protein (DUF849 family)